MENKLYIHSFQDNLKLWSNFRSNPFYWICRAITKFFTKSKVNHIADNYHYKGRNKFINQMVGTGSESIHYLDCFKGRDANIYAYEIIVPIDFDLWHENTEESKDYEFDIAGLLWSEAHERKWAKIFFNEEKIKADKKKLFCDELTLWKLQNQGYLQVVKNRNEISTIELIDLMIKYGLCTTTPVLVWDGKQIVNNVFETVS